MSKRKKKKVDKNKKEKREAYVKMTTLLFSTSDREQCNLFPCTEERRTPPLMETAIFYVPYSAFYLPYSIITKHTTWELAKVSVTPDVKQLPAWDD